VLFEAKTNVSLVAQPLTHYKTGVKIADAYPVV
jgi:phosphatidylserine decarboxylase